MQSYFNSIPEDSSLYWNKRNINQGREVQALETTVLECLNISTELIQKAYERNKLSDTALMIIFLYSEIRVSDLANMNISDLDISNLTILIVRKGNKRDKIPYPDVVGEYLNYRKNMKEIYTYALFVSQFRSRITIRAIEHIIEKYAARANITKKVTPHTLRRTFLTTFYNKTKDVDATRRVAGHSTVLTIMRHYASTSEEQFKEQLYNFN
ncbi:tyrosine-type recombinase/integrase [Clostridium saccharoperbutylacetonicum]|uniref:tyrosine-type recombinase/integrase n=1 Tax=Clostridium saccharoperbutylacetonicum TaxID=36745 RepID=UPI00098399B0|nr:tyrosine-type recombinase/integrase [Clostridium saccharoperbutylacetonicum]AQR93099.1 tyrosine recombinase XerC [Clostridium saccharoperbutylacetonicum]NSB34509.1 integrase [Clostridium saccharoperbutylacetonicum]